MNGYQNMMQQPQGGVPIMPSGTPQITPELQSMVQREMQNPTGLMPLPQLYALNSLIQRLQNSAPVQQPQTSVAQDLAATADQMLGYGQQQQPPQMMAQGQPAPEETQTMAHGGVAGLPSYNFMPDNYAHGGIVAFDEGGASRADIRNAQVAAEQEGVAAESKKLSKFEKLMKLGRTPVSQAATAAARPVGAGLMSLGKGFISSPATYVVPAAGALASTLAGGSALEGALKPDMFARALGEGIARILPAGFKGLTKEEIAAADSQGASDIEDRFNNPPAVPTPAPTTVKTTDAEKAAAASLADRVRDYMRTTGAGADGEGRRGSGTTTPTGSATTAVSPNETGLKEALARQKTELADAKKRAEALKPKERSVFEAEEEARYKAAGIGKAAEAEQVRLDARQKGLEGENKAAFWNDLAKAGFKMASRAGARGKDATNFFGALAAGGEDFSESNIKTASKFQALREDLAEKQSKFAVANEAVKMNRMDKADALYRDAKRDYEAANKDVINFGTKMTGDQIEAHTKLIAAEEAHRKAVDLAKINNDARAREAKIAAGDRNTVQRQLLQAYHNALKNKDQQAADEILKNLTKVTAATTGFGASERSSNEAMKAFNRRDDVRTARLQVGSADPKIRQQGEAALARAMQTEGIGGGDNSAVRSAADKILSES
jgi:hypothetical protein